MLKGTKLTPDFPILLITKPFGGWEAAGLKVGCRKSR